MIASIENLDDISSKILDILGDGGVVLLQGDLASGKTTLVKNFVKYLGISDDVSSPTFSIMQIYGDRVFHYDIYNEGVSKFIESGLIENLEESGYHFIEWADERLENILKTYGIDYIKVEILPKDDKREYRFEA